MANHPPVAVLVDVKGAMCSYLRHAIQSYLPLSHTELHPVV